MDIKECANCGYKSETAFSDDICPECGQTYWKCETCGYTLNTTEPPDICPSCGKKF